MAGAALGVLGEALYQLSAHASYPRRDAASPLMGMAIRVGFTLVGGIGAAAIADGTAFLFTLVLTMGMADIAGALVVHRRVMGRDWARSLRPLIPPAMVSLVCFGAIQLLYLRTGHADIRPPVASAIALAAGIGGMALLVLARLAMKAPEMLAMLPARHHSADRADTPAPTMATSRHAPVGNSSPDRNGSLSSPGSASHCSSARLVGRGREHRSRRRRHDHPRDPDLRGATSRGVGDGAGTPFVVGFDRDQFVPVLRPNEALLLAVAFFLGLRWIFTSRTFRLRLNRVDLIIMLLIATGSAVPLVVQYARLKPPVDRRRVLRDHPHQVRACSTRSSV